MNALLMDFHFIRPAVLLLLVPLALLLIWIKNSEQQSQAWEAYIAPELLKFLLHSANRKLTSHWPWLACLWLIAILGIAGPAWEKLPAPVFKSQAASVYLLDLSPSMLAEDLKPNRFTRAQQKLTDAVRRQQDGLMALIVYSGDAHLVMPLTDDAHTLESLIPSLSPRIMPSTGSNIEMAVELAYNTLKESHIEQGQLVLITDGISRAAQSTLTNLVSDNHYPIQIISIGDESGVPIPLGQQGFAKDSNGKLVLVKNDRSLLKQLASVSGGQFSNLSINDSDITFLQKTPAALDEGQREVERNFDQWRDRGYWLAWLLLPFTAYGFRKALLFCTPLLLPIILSGGVIFFPAPAHAQTAEKHVTEANETNSPAVIESGSNQTSWAQSTWQRLWKNPDQQGQQALAENNPKRAAQLFDDPRWRANAQYSAQDFEAAAATLDSTIKANSEKDADDFYNLGNAQAQAQQLKQAIQSYDQALELRPDMSDARYNRNLVQERLKEQEQQADKDQDQDQDQDQDNKDSKSGGEKKEDKNSGEKSGDNGDKSQSQEQPSDSDSSQDSEKSKDQKQDSQEGAATEEQPSENELGDYSESKNPKEATDEKASNSRNETQAELDKDNAKGADNNNVKTAEDAFSDLSDEEKQAMEQWLRQVQDDPAGLLKRKFEYQYRQRRQAIKDGDWQPPENDAHERW